MERALAPPGTRELCTVWRAFLSVKRSLFSPEESFKSNAKGAACQRIQSVIYEKWVAISSLLVMRNIVQDNVYESLLLPLACMKTFFVDGDSDFYPCESPPWWRDQSHDWTHLWGRTGPPVKFDWATEKTKFWPIAFIVDSDKNLFLFSRQRSR
eukprot:g42687.t1